MPAILEQTEQRWAVRAKTAAELMTPNAVSLRENATVDQALAVFLKKNFAVAPVITMAGRAIGTVSASDILIHKGQQTSGEQSASPALVRDIMTPAIFSVLPSASATVVIEEMLALRVHHLFVTDCDLVPMGVISALDILRALGPDE